MQPFLCDKSSVVRDTVKGTYCIYRWTDVKYQNVSLLNCQLGMEGLCFVRVGNYFSPDSKRDVFFSDSSVRHSSFKVRQQMLHVTVRRIIIIIIIIRG